MSFYDAVRSALSKYATFSGRASRSEFWFFYLFWLLACGIAGVIDALIINSSFSPLTTIAVLGLLIPFIAVTIRRLHDIDRSGWWQLLPLVPIVGAIILLIWWCKPGTPGSNRFGSNPL